MFIPVLLYSNVIPGSTEKALKTSYGSQCLVINVQMNC